jgi:hypothetical protein
MSDLDALAEKWLKVCPPCDAGLPDKCTHPDQDYRPVLKLLLEEVRGLRVKVDQLRRLRDPVARWREAYRPENVHDLALRQKAINELALAAADVMREKPSDQ